MRESLTVKIIIVVLLYATKKIQDMKEKSTISIIEFQNRYFKNKNKQSYYSINSIYIVVQHTHMTTTN